MYLVVIVNVKGMRWYIGMDMGRMAVTAYHSLNAQEYPVGGRGKGVQSTQLWGPLHHVFGLCGRAPLPARVGDLLLELWTSGCSILQLYLFSF